MRLIDADAVRDAINEKILKVYEIVRKPDIELDEEMKIRVEQEIATYCEASLIVSKMPTVDAVPVIRCRDCKWYEEDIGCDWGVCFHDDWTHRDVGHGVDGDGYCYRAERKEG